MPVIPACGRLLPDSVGNHDNTVSKTNTGPLMSDTAPHPGFHFAAYATNRPASPPPSAATPLFHPANRTPAAPKPARQVSHHRKPTTLNECRDQRTSEDAGNRSPPATVPRHPTVAPSRQHQQGRQVLPVAAIPLQLLRSISGAQQHTPATNNYADSRDTTSSCPNPKTTTRQTPSRIRLPETASGRCRHPPGPEAAHPRPTSSEHNGHAPQPCRDCSSAATFTCTQGGASNAAGNRSTTPRSPATHSHVSGWNCKPPWN